MPLIEVEDAVLSALRENGVRLTDKTAAAQQAAEAEAAWRKILGSPKRRDALAIYKEVFPDAAVPELDAAKPLNDDMAALRKEFSDYRESIEAKEKDRETKRAERAAHDTVSKGRTWLRGDKKLDDEGVKAVEQVMQDEGIASYSVAFNHWRASQPADPEPLPTSVVGRSLDWFKSDTEDQKADINKMLTNPTEWRRNMVHKVLTEERTKNAA